MSIEYYVGKVRSALEEAQRQAIFGGISLRGEYAEGTPEYELQHRLYSEINLAELELNLSQSRRAELDPIERKMALSIYLKVASQVRPDSNIYENSLSRIDDLPEHKSHLRVA